jgi:hypothetical protein
LLRHLFDIIGNPAGGLAVQQHYIDIARWVKLAPPVSAERDERQRTFDEVAGSAHSGGARGENVSQKNIDKIDPAPADFPATAAGLMFQAQAMFLDFKELFVNRKDFGRALPAGGTKLVLSMRENLFQMARHGVYRS